MGKMDLGIENDEGDIVLLRPSQEILLSRKCEGTGVKIIEKVQDAPGSASKKKKSKEDDMNDN